MSDAGGSDLPSLYARRRDDALAEALAHGARSRLISNLRGVSFGTFVIAGLFALFGDDGDVAGPLSGVGFVGFVVLLFVHAKVIRAEDAARRRAQVNADAHARVTDGWRELPADGARFADAAHPYADDLDVFGRGSLYQRVSVAHTHFGQEALANLLRAPASAADISLRQEAVRALTTELDVRQALEAHALLAVDAPTKDRKRPPRPAPDPEPLLAWAESEPRLTNRALLVWAARVLPVATLAGIGWALWFGGPVAGWGLPLFLQIVLIYATREDVVRAFNAVSATEGAFTRYGAMLEILEQLDVDSRLVKSMQERAKGDAGRPPSLAMNDFRRAVSWFELRHNGLVHPFANALLSWDIHCVLGVERWQARSGKAARVWLQCLGELEALSSLAGLAHDEPGFAFPKLTSAPKFSAVGLGHPLIFGERRVSNDVELPRAGTAMLVTGSNMSGKSTLLRAMGLAAVMAGAGAPVCARSATLGLFAVRTSIRVSDSLERGVSHFYAELRKLKAVMDATTGTLPVFFLLDEILHGTNSLERQIGARWVLAQLLERGALGAISTHDMELCRLPEPLMQHVQQVHFRESVENDKMTFDYRLRPGPVSAGNALQLMRIIGLDVPLE